MSAIFGADKKAITAITANDGIATRKISAVWGNVGGQKTKLWELHKELTIGSLPVGSLLKIAENGITQQYIIVNQGNPNTALYDSSCNGTWALRKYLAEIKKMNESIDNRYGISEIHAYLNSTFLTAFSTEIQSKIKQAKIPYVKEYIADGTIASGNDGLSAKTFLLSGYEIGFTSAIDSKFPHDGEKLSYFVEGNSSEAKNKRIAMPSGSSNSKLWWIRSPCYTNYYRAGSWAVSLDGSAEICSSTSALYCRPAMILDPVTIVSATPDSDGCYTLI